VLEIPYYIMTLELYCMLFKGETQNKRGKEWMQGYSGRVQIDGASVCCKILTIVKIPLDGIDGEVCVNLNSP
jgi:hypothetical protein